MTSSRLRTVRGAASRYNGLAEMKEYAEAVVKPARDGKH
jgi:hypothetical protein